MQAHRDNSSSLFGRHAPMAFLAMLALGYCVVALIVRVIPLSNVFVLFIVVSAAYVPVLAVIGVALALMARRKLLSTAAVLVLVATLLVQVPWYYFGHPVDVGPHTEVRVLSANLRKGRADVASIVGLARQGADVITVSELTPDIFRRFTEAGIDGIFPYSLLFPAPEAGGIGLWSRYPISAVSPTKPGRPGRTAVRLQIPGVRYDPLVASVHITSPLTNYGRSFGDWHTAIAAAKAELTDFADAAGPGAVIVAGDYNSTPDMRQFRDLLTNGYRDAVHQTGAGFAPTFPSQTWHPPLITIDHVLTRQAVATSIRTIFVPGSDHRALLASIAVPLDPTAS